MSKDKKQEPETMHPLRPLFAASALQGLLSVGSHPGSTHLTAALSVAYADAMVLAIQMHPEQIEEVITAAAGVIPRQGVPQRPKLGLVQPIRPETEPPKVGS